jgi:putative heme-binding domain-containing protein
LAALLRNENGDEQTRIAATKALGELKTDDGVVEISKVFSNSAETEKLRAVAAQMLAKINSANARSSLVGGLSSASRALRREIALALAANREGAEALLEAVENGKISAHVLQENAVKERLNAANPDRVNERVAKLTENLQTISKEKQKLIDARRIGFAAAKPSVKNGQKIFSRTCALCHSIGGRGGNVGPQLDGVGNRGADRIIEDILDPNRNVDPAFYYSNVTLKDDTVVTGLFRREEGEVLVFANTAGQEIPIPKKEIVEQRLSKNSLMPDNFSDAIPQSDFYDLVSFLLSKRTTQN